MKYLREITQIVTRYREKNIDLLSDEPSSEDEDNISKLYLGLKEGKITSDIEATKEIYESTLIDTRYTTLKNRLKRRLLNHLFFLDIREKDFSEYVVARYQNTKSVFWINTLSAFGARNSTIKLTESALKQANKYNFTLNAVQFTLFLRNYSRFSGSERQYNKHDKELQVLLKTYERELRSQELYERLTIRFTRSAAEQPDLFDVSTEYLNELEGYKAVCDSFIFNQYYFRVKTTVLQILQKYQEAVLASTEAIEYFDNNKHIAFKALYGEFYIQELSCYLHLRDYVKGKETAEKCMPLTPEGTGNWYLVMELRFLLEMHTFHFPEAETVYNEAISHPRYQFLPEETKEKWQIFELYVHFALRQTSSATISKERQKVDLQKYLKTVPTFKKDKRGYNIAILILQVVLLLEQNDFGAIIGRMDALRTYRNRYLQVSTNRRSALFFKMLQIMEANSFDPKTTYQKGKKYFDRLSISTADVSEVQDGLQILPFDWLWETIISMLEKKQQAGVIQKM